MAPVFIYKKGGFDMTKQYLKNAIKHQNFIYMVIIAPICLVHIILLFFFLMFDVTAMACLNISSIAVYIYCIDYLKKGKSPIKTFCMTYIEILIHSFMATICVGWELGFAQYMIGLVPFGYYTYVTIGGSSKQKYLPPTMLGLGSFISYLLCRWIGVHSLSTFYTLPLSINGKYVVYAFNTICVFTLLFWSASAFIININMVLNDLKKTNEQLKKMAYIDPLTKLYNRRHMMELFEKAGDDYCIIMCDIDNFKHVNDTYGHDFGDLVLKNTAAIIMEKMKNIGYVCRWGGEEIIILHTGSFDETCMSAEQIRLSVSTHDFTMSDKTLHCSITIGVSQHISGESVDATIKRADERLYWGKQNGKNMVVSKD